MREDLRASDERVVAEAQHVSLDLERFEPSIHAVGAEGVRGLGEKRVEVAAELVVATVDRRGSGPAARMSTHPGRRGARAPDVSRFVRFRCLQESVGRLQGPCARRTVPSPHRPGIEDTWVHEIPPLLVRLAAVKERPLDLPGAPVEPGSEDAHRNVCRINRVMRERRCRILERRRAVHEGDGPKRRFTDWRAGERE